MRMSRSKERCGSPTKTTGAPCQRPCYPGSHRCIMHSGPLTVEGRRAALAALEVGRKTAMRNRKTKREAKARVEEAARQWLADFAPESPMIDALVDPHHAAHAGTLEHAKRLVSVMRGA
jgi:hypothetical protein